MPTPVDLRDRRAGRRIPSPTAPGTATTPRTGRLATRRRQLTSWWRQLTARPDTGAATAELVIAMPLLLGIIMTVIQAGIWLHATHIAQAAANHAAGVAAAHGSTATAGQHAGHTTLAELGHSVLIAPTVTVTRTATQVRVEVTGTAATVVPGVTWTVRATVIRPVERFVPDTREFENPEHGPDGDSP